MNIKNYNKVRVLIATLVVLLSACSDKQDSLSESATTDKNTSANQDSSVKQNLQWIEGWYPAEPMTTNRAGAAAVAHNGFIYVIGGVDGRSFLATTEYAKINTDGSLGQWQAGPHLKEDRGFIDAIVHNGSIYVVGGGNGPNGKNLLRTTERAKINADGSLGPWQTEKNLMVTPRRCSKILAVGGFLYSLGGFAGTLLDSVERSKILADGTLGEWELEAQAMTIPRYINTVKTIKNNLYVIGGHDQNKGVGITDVEWAMPSADGSIKDWQKADSLQTPRYGLTSAKLNNHIYALGGLTGLEYLDSVEMMKINSDGVPGPWRFTTPLSVPRATFNALSYQDKIYVIGGTNQDRYLNNVEFATTNEQGDLGVWGTEQDAKSYAEFKAQIKQAGPDLANQGEVLHIQQASMYTYVNVRSNLGDIWIAGPKAELKVGEKIQFSKGVSMSNFYSKELQQQFPVILFVSKIELTR